MAVRVLVGGDVCPVWRHVEAFEAGRPRDVIAGLRERLEGADLNVFNLECALSDDAAPMAKTGPTLGAGTACARGLAALPCHVANLANNHVMDFGPDGLLSTLRATSEAGVRTFGAGANRDEAGRVLVVETRGLRVGFLGLAGKEFSLAGDASPGAFPLDPIEAEGAIRRSAGAWDVLLVFVHAGNHLYPYPSPSLQSLGRWLVELGAAAVVFQHSHRIGCAERHGEGLIVYGQGNFVFDWVPDPGREWNEGILLDLTVEKRGITSWDVVPVARDPLTAVVSPLEGARKEGVMLEFRSRSDELASADLVRNRWIEYCRDLKEDYLGMLTGQRLFSRIRRQLRLRTGVSWAPWTRERRLLLGNLVRCEDHREVLETILLEEPERIW